MTRLPNLVHCDVTRSQAVIEEPLERVGYCFTLTVSRFRGLWPWAI